MPSSSDDQKKKAPKGIAKKKVDQEILKQRREVIEKRILRLEGKLIKDRELLVRYAEDTKSSDSDVVITAETEGQQA